MDLCRPASLDKPIITQARLLFAMKRLVVLTVLASFIFAVGGQTTLSSERWRVVNCTNPYGASTYLTIETNNCDITSKRPCATKLINSGFLQETCSPLIDGITYKCLISTDYIYLVCCILHKEGIRETISNSCIPIATSTQGPTGLTDISTAAASTGPNLNNISDPPMKDNNYPYIPAYVAVIITFIIFIIVVVAVVAAVVFSVWCYCTCKPGRRRSVPRSVPENSDEDPTSPSEENPIPMGAAGAGGVDTGGRRQSSPSQEKFQDASQGGSQAPATTDMEQENKLRRRNLPTVEMRQPRQEVTKAEEELRGSTRAVPSKDPSTGYTPESVIQSFSGPCGPTCTTDNFIIQEDMSSPSAPTAAQASDDGNSPYVPTLLKSSSLDNNDLVTAHMSHLECKDDIQEKPSITPVVQGHMQSLDQDDPEAEALVVQQKVKVGEDTSSAVAHKQRSCFKSGGTDDETRGSVSRKDPLKKHKFPPAHFGTVGVAITCALILATFVCHGRGYTSTIPHPSFASKYRWLDRGTPWIRAIADRLAYPQNLGPAAYCGIFPMTLTTLISLYNQCQHKTADPTLNDQAYNYQWLDRGTWIGAIAYPLMFGSPNLRLAVYYGIVMLTTLALIIMATMLISLFDQFQPGPIRTTSAVKHVSLTAIKSCRWTGTSCEPPCPPDCSSVSIVG